MTDLKIDIVELLGYCQGFWTVSVKRVQIVVVSNLDKKISQMLLLTVRVLSLGKGIFGDVIVRVEISAVTVGTWGGSLFGVHRRHSDQIGLGSPSQVYWITFMPIGIIRTWTGQEKVIEGIRFVQDFLANRKVWVKTHLCTKLKIFIAFMLIKVFLIFLD